MPSTIHALRGRATGAMFFSIFGAVWLLGACKLALAGPGAQQTAIAIGALLLLAAVWRLRVLPAAPALDAEGERTQAYQSKVFRNVNVAQWAAIGLLGWLLPRMGLGPWVLPGAILVVGLHFLPLAALFANRAHFVTGGVLTLWALAYPFLLANPLHPLGCAVTGLVLWTSAAYALAKTATFRPIAV